MARTSFSSIRKALAEHGSKELVALVGELYALSAQNRAFLDARFAPSKSMLSPYKKMIQRSLYPAAMSAGPPSFRNARKAISDYREAAGKAAGLAELYVYATECGTNFTCDFGDIDGPFYSSLELMFDSAAKIVSMLDPEAAEPFIARLGAVVKKAERIGYGYYDTISYIFLESFPAAKKS